MNRKKTSKWKIGIEPSFWWWWETVLGREEQSRASLNSSCRGWSQCHHWVIVGRRKATLIGSKKWLRAWVLKTQNISDLKHYFLHNNIFFRSSLQSLRAATGSLSVFFVRFLHPIAFQSCFRTSSQSLRESTAENLSISGVNHALSKESPIIRK